MPQMNGLNFLEAVREDYPGLPFILFTGKGSEDIAEQAINAGVTSYLQKEGGSSNYTVLANHIENAVSQYRAERYANTLQRDYELVAKTATDAFWMVDLRTDTISLSDGVGQFGYGPDQNFDRGWFFEQVHPDDRNQLQEHNEAILTREEWAFDELSPDRGTFSDEFRFQRADGSYAHVEGRGVMLFEDGTPVKKVGSMADITEQKERQQELETIRTRLQTIIDTVPAAVFTWDNDGQVQLLNKFIREMFGLEGEQLQGRSMSELLPPDLTEQVHESYRQVLDTGDTVSVEEQITIDGEVRTFLTSYAPIYTSTGDRPDAVCGVATDVTELKRREEQLQRERERLDEFMSVVSHDLRNPLNVVEGRLELAREECESDHLTAATAALDRAQSLIENLLILAREGEQIRDVETVDLAELAEASWENVKTAEATLGIETECRVRADESRLQQLLENLFRNAVEHGGADVTVTIGELDGGFYVADDGARIPESIRDQLFERGVSSGGGGIGFGLTIVKTIADAHGWDVGVTDSERGGARFEIQGVTTTTVDE